MYRPEGSVEVIDTQQIRLGIQGPGGVGKTWASLTFPNPVVVNFDKGLGAHVGKSILEIPFWDPVWVDKYYPREHPSSRLPNRRDAFKKWMEKEAVKFQNDQTLIIDGGTSLENAFHAQCLISPFLTKQGKVDDFGEWAYKKTYYGELFEMLKSLKCHVVYVSHEQVDRTKEGELNGKIKPLLSGQAGDQIIGHFTDWFRAHCFMKKPAKDFKFEDWGMNEKEMQELLNQFQSQEMYIWQTKPDDKANCKCSSLVNQPKYMKADYETFLKLLRKNQPKISQ